MAAPTIPNLLTLKTAGRGRGGSGSRDRRHRPATAASPDAAIQGTDTDAAVSRFSAVQLGYLEDAYAGLFVTGPPARRLPIINRGTYVRTKSLDSMIYAFLMHNDSSPTRQIISLGAGSDTRPLHLLQRTGLPHLIYHELDFEPTCRRKLAMTQSSPILRPIFKDWSLHDGGSWSAELSTGSEYHCHALDLRHISKSIIQLPPTIRSDVPTLLLSECCLCYLDSRDSEDVLRFFSLNIANLATLLYEPMPLDDAFGTMMVSNLRARQIHMPSLEVYKNQEKQLYRLQEVGFTNTKSVTIEQVWDLWVDKNERDRVDGLEGLDEIEEWKLLAAHYVVVWGCKGVATFGPAGDRHAGTTT